MAAPSSAALSPIPPRHAAHWLNNTSGMLNGVTLATGSTLDEATISMPSVIIVNGLTLNSTLESWGASAETMTTMLHLIFRAHRR